MSSDSLDNGFDSVALKMSPRSSPEVAMDLSYSDHDDVMNYSCHHRSALHSQPDSPAPPQSPWQEDPSFIAENYSPYGSRDRSRSNSHSRSPTPHAHSPSPARSPPLDTQMTSHNSPVLSISSDSPSSPPPFQCNYRVPVRLSSISSQDPRLSKDPRVARHFSYALRSTGAALNSDSPPSPPTFPPRTRSPHSTRSPVNSQTDRNDPQGSLASLLESSNSLNSNSASNLSQSLNNQRSETPETLGSCNASIAVERPITAAADSTQEVVDVEQAESQPCVVDLTAEEDDDDDDVEIVSTEPSVVFLGTEPRRRASRRRKRRLAQNTNPSESASDTIVLNDSEPSSTAPNPSSATPSTGSRSPELFGDLLIPQSSASVDEPTAVSRRGCSCPLPTIGAARTYDFRACPVHSQLQRASDRGSNHPDEALHGPHHSRNSIMEAGIPQDVLADIASIYAENRYRLPSALRLGGPSLYGSGVGATTAIEIGHHRHPYGSSSHADQKKIIKLDLEEPTEWSCPICFESKKEVKKASKSFSSTICGHVFCTPCLEASLKQAKLCPICRKKLSKKQYHTVFI